MKATGGLSQATMIDNTKIKKLPDPVKSKGNFCKAVYLYLGRKVRSDSAMEGVVFLSEFTGHQITCDFYIIDFAEAENVMIHGLGDVACNGRGCSITHSLIDGLGRTG